MRKGSRDYLKNTLLKGGKYELDNFFKIVQDNPSAKIFTGLRVPDYRNDTKNTTIDKVIFVANLCFVVEEKSYTTSITGILEDYQWYGMSGKRFTWFRNPIKQNLHHTTCLTMWLKKNGQKTRDYKFVQLVVVPDSCEINVPPELVTTVLNKSTWEARLREFQEKPINQDIITFIGGNHV